MLPNWLYTQHLLPVEIASEVANPDLPRADVVELLLATRLNGALAREGFTDNWEQTGRALAALGSVCPRTAVTFAGHLAEQYRLLRRGESCPPGLLVGASIVDIEVEKPRSRPTAQSYLAQAALLASAAVGIATTSVRRAAGEEVTGLGSAATAVLTAQAGILRVLSMLDALAYAGKDAGGTVSASFHTVVRGSARLLENTPFGSEVLVATGHPVLQDEPWSRRVEESLSGNWASFECPA